jgi:hypothetical protein
MESSSSPGSPLSEHNGTVRYQGEVETNDGDALEDQAEGPDVVEVREEEEEEEEENEVLPSPSKTGTNFDGKSRFLLPVNGITDLPYVIPANALETLIFRTEVKEAGGFTFALFPKQVSAPYPRKLRLVPEFLAHNSLAPLSPGHYRISVCPKHRLICVINFTSDGIITKAMMPRDEELHVVVSAKRSDTGGMPACRFYDAMYVAPSECLCDLPLIAATDASLD